MLKLKIHLDAPNVGQLEKKYLNEAIDQGFVSTGPFIHQFENKIADYLGVKGAVSVQSGTAAIYMALYELGIGPGDEVIVTSLSFAATVNPILYVGATPVIVDIDCKTWNIDPSRIKDAITDRTKAIILVHLYGNPCHMTEILQIALKKGLYIIEDATESLGAKFDGKHTGVWGDFGCFSFNGNKLITTGGGGIVVSNNRKRIEHIRYLINQAKDKGKPGYHKEMGFNYRMTNIEAAIGLAQFERINNFLEKKKLFKKIYQDVLKGVPDLSFQQKHSKALESSWFICMRLKKNIHIVPLMKELEKKGIPTRRIFKPLNEMPYLRGYAHHCPNASEIYNSGICLPSSTLNEAREIMEAASLIRKVLENRKK